LSAFISLFEFRQKNRMILQPVKADAFSVIPARRLESRSTWTSPEACKISVPAVGSGMHVSLFQPLQQFKPVKP
jgi:hypothetical protein